MPQPSEDPRWADLAAPADVVNPASGIKDAGWTLATTPVPPHTYFNWWMNRVYQWQQYLKFITTELLTWTVLQTFNARIVVTAASGTNAIAATGPIAGDGIVATGGNSNTTAVQAGFGVRGIGGNATVGTADGGYGGRFTGGTAAAGGVPGRGVVASGANSTLSGFQAGHGGAFNGGVATTGNAEGGCGLTASGGASAGNIRGGCGAVLLGGTGGASGAGGPGLFVSAGSGGSGQAAGSGIEAFGAAGIGGGADGAGIFAVGGGVTGTGIVARGAGTSKAAKFEMTTYSATNTVVECAGNIFISGNNLTHVPPFTNTLTRMNIPKAWVRIRLNNSTSPTILSGFNISAVTATGTNIAITTATSFLNGDSYVWNFTILPNGTSTRTALVTGFTSGVTVFELRSNGDSILNPTIGAMSNVEIWCSANGWQP